MAVERMGREEFFARLGELDEARLKKALWNLYWRGAAPVRERIEAEIAPAQAALRKTTREKATELAPDEVLRQVHEFTSLARAGSYLAGDRRVSPKERSGWRHTFRRLDAAARAALAAPDPDPAEQAVAALVDLALYAKHYQCFRSDDPMEAAKFVASEAVSQLWSTALRRRGIHGFARYAMPQLVRWEQRFGWTIRGFGTVAERETSLAAVLRLLLPSGDAWVVCAEEYVQALDGVVTPRSTGQVYPPGLSAKYLKSSRADSLEEWHDLLLDRLPDHDATALLHRIAGHPSLGGASHRLYRAKLARLEDALPQAQSLAAEGLEERPGHGGLLAFAAEVGAQLPPRARKVASSRSVRP